VREAPGDDAVVAVRDPVGGLRPLGKRADEVAEAALAVDRVRP
jgi:hypothetical protein